MSVFLRHGNDTIGVDVACNATVGDLVDRARRWSAKEQIRLELRGGPLREFAQKLADAGVCAQSVVDIFDHESEDEEGRLNARLQDRLEAHFKPLGIVAYSCCCRLGCTGNYGDEIAPRDNGVVFIRLHLDGMNYHPSPESCYAQYRDFDYLMANWDQEKALLEKWCELLGLGPGGYTITKPDNDDTAIEIQFTASLHLEEEPDEAGDEDDS